tara:strand:+ start:28526 stop:29407 length:882 start_codon:yes stop_codon:yes gene_type:complete
MSFNRYMRGMSNGGVIAARTGEVLTNDELRSVVPSIFATEAHESRSARFAPIPTANVLDGLRAEGFDPFFAQQAKTRIAGKQEFTKHMLRLRHRSLTRADGEAFEVILVNANDGTSSYQMLPGFFRFVCANGLMVGDTFEEVKVRHTGEAVHEVIEGAYRVLEEAPRVTEQVDAFKHLRLSQDEQHAFAEAAHILRFPNAHAPEAEEAKPAPITAEMLLRPRRRDDMAENLWTTFNVVQENVIRGGQAGRVRDANNRLRRASTREVKGIDQNKALNRALWTLAERMTELKSAA